MLIVEFTLPKLTEIRKNSLISAIDLALSAEPAVKPSTAPPPRSIERSANRMRVCYPPTLAVAVAVSALSLLAGCGGPSSPGVATGSPTTTTPTATTSIGHHAPAPSLLGYAACMRVHGVPNFPDPGGKGGIPKPALVRALTEVSSSQAQAASKDCQDLLPAGGLSGQPVRTIPVQDEQDYLHAAA